MFIFVTVTPYSFFILGWPIGSIIKIFSHRIVWRRKRTIKGKSIYFTDYPLLLMIKSGAKTDGAEIIEHLDRGRKESFGWEVHRLWNSKLFFFVCFNPQTVYEFHLSILHIENKSLIIEFAISSADCKSVVCEMCKI